MDIDNIISDLKHSDKDIRIRAIKKLSDLKDPRSVQPLIQTMWNDPVVDVNLAAKDALLEIGDDSSLTELLEFAYFNLRLFSNFKKSSLISALKKMYYAGEHEGYHILNAIVSLDIPEALNIIDGALSDQDGIRRREALEILNEIEDFDKKRFIPKVKDLLEDSDSYIRYAAIEFFWRIGDPVATELLVKRLKDENEQIVEFALLVLGSIGDKKTLNELEILTKTVDKKKDHCLRRLFE